MHISVILGTFTELHSSDNPVLEHFHQLRKLPHACLFIPCCSPMPQATTDWLSFSRMFVFSRNFLQMKSYKLLCLASLI